MGANYRKSSMTLEPVTLAGGECTHVGDIEENIGQPCVRSALTWITALSRGLDPMAFYAPSISIYSMSKREPKMASVAGG